MLALLAEASTVEQKVHIDVGILTFVVGMLIPVLTSLITKSSASAAVKAITTLLLSGLATIIYRIIEVNGVVNLKTALSTLAATWFTAIVTYYGLLKPTTVTEKFANVAPTKGIG